MIFPPIILAIENDADREFMTQLYLQYRTPMYKVAMRMLRDEGDTEDVINDSFVAFIRHIEKLRGFESYRLYAYVMTTVKNFAVNRINKRDRENMRSVYDDGLIERIPDGKLTDTPIIQENQMAELLDAISHLPTIERSVLELKYLNEWTNAEIADELGITADMVRSYLSRARKHAATMLVKGGVE